MLYLYQEVGKYKTNDNGLTSPLAERNGFRITAIFSDIGGSIPQFSIIEKKIYIISGYPLDIEKTL